MGMFSFVRNYQAVFQNSGTNFGAFPNVPHPGQHLVFSTFQILAIVLDVQWYLILFFFFNLNFSDDIYDVKHLFMCLLAICISSLMKC